jgi:hypothetical protein
MYSASAMYVAATNVFVALGILPSLVELLLIMPIKDDVGFGGVELGYLTPLFVFIFNTLGWSIPGYAWFCLTGVLRAGYLTSTDGLPHGYCALVLVSRAEYCPQVLRMIQPCHPPLFKLFT